MKQPVTSPDLQKSISGWSAVGSRQSVAPSATAGCRLPTAISNERLPACTSANPSISVVICAYTDARWAELVAAVGSLHAQSCPPAEIIVVIDHNRALLDRARAALAGVKVIENHQQRGLSGARNCGVALASGDIVAFMDEDALAAPDWLAQLSAPYADAAVLGVGGAIVPLWAGGRPGWFPAEFDWVVGCTYLGMPTQPAPVRNLIGCNMSFRRSVFAEVGGFRHEIGRVGTLPVGCEETELCIRLRQRWPHSTLLLLPQAQVRHRVPAARACWAYFRARCFAEGISKAQVARLVGAGDGLATERGYVLHTLPLGVLHALGAALRGDAAGLPRAGALAAGLALTTLGYLRGRLQPWLTGFARLGAQEAR